ncbi:MULTISPECIES: allantoinase AllB [Alicyclobacillus]|uniref:allantoinase AllB n=1 Tax=Alicyclobacillus TaxID=29330 RepID=UPI001A8C377C
MPVYDVILRNGLVVTESSALMMDLAITNGRIAAMGSIDGRAEVQVDVSGHWVMPGVIDAHVHLNEPGTDWEGFETGSRALAAGGCTLFVDMPLNGVPPTIDPSALMEKKACATGKSVIDFAFWGGLVPHRLDQLEPLADAGVLGFKAFLSAPGGPSADHGYVQVDDATLYEGMRILARVGLPLLLHAENGAIADAIRSQLEREGRLTARDYAASRPPEVELEAVQRALTLAEATGCRLHFVHISTPESVHRVQEAKRKGLDVTLETCPHYLALTVDDFERLGPVAKCAPPLRDEQTRLALWDLLRRGLIDDVASDHSPCPMDMKRSASGNYFDVWGGIAGGQSTLEVMLDEGLRQGLRLVDVARLTATHPAKRLGVYPRKGVIQIGSDADLAIINPAESYTLRSEHLFQRHPHSPYIGRTFSSRVVQTWCRGHLVYQAHGDPTFPTAGIGQWIRSAHSSHAERA